jgi:hypothetical protein
MQNIAINAPKIDKTICCVWFCGMAHGITQTTTPRKTLKMIRPKTVIRLLTTHKLQGDGGKTVAGSVARAPIGKFLVGFAALPFCWLILRCGRTLENL